MKFTNNLVNARDSNTGEYIKNRKQTLNTNASPISNLIQSNGSQIRIAINSILPESIHLSVILHTFLLYCQTAASCRCQYKVLMFYSLYVIINDIVAYISCKINCSKYLLSYTPKSTLMYILPYLQQSAKEHYSGVIIITGVPTVCSTVCSGAEQRKHKSSAWLPFVSGIHRLPVDSPHKGQITRKMFPFDDAIMISKHYRIA